MGRCSKSNNGMGQLEGEDDWDSEAGLVMDRGKGSIHGKARQVW